MPARLANTAYTDVPWRAHEIAGALRIEDVLAVRTPGGGPDDFPAVLEAIERYETSRPDPALLRLLFAVRWKLGALFGWDARETGLGERVSALCAALPEDLASGPRGTDRGLAPFAPVYQLPDEAVLELANKTVHTAMHLGWTPVADGGHELRMTVLVKPNGLLGRLYLAAIAPIRHLVVLPMFLRRWELAWREATASIHGVAGVDAIPSSVLALSSLPVIDYGDQFTLSTDIQAPPEQWARAMFGDVPDLAERFVWRGLLGLRLQHGRSHTTVAGWRIGGRGADWIRLEADSGLLTGNLVVRTGDGQVSLTTLVHYERGLGRAWWPPLSAIHRRLTPGVLRDAAAELAMR